MRPGTRGLALGVALLGVGCVHLNALYNAQRLFDEAERESRQGRDTLARPLYDSVVAKTARTYRRDPEGGRADDALYLMGRAYLRRGEPERASSTLRRALELAGNEPMRAAVRLHLGMAAASAGDPAGALIHLDEALATLERRALRAEGHLWRARVHLEAGRTDAGWADLDRAARTHDRYRVDAGLERLRWGVAHGDSVRAREGAVRLLAIREAHLREDTVRRLVQHAARRWGPATGLDLLAGAGASAWPPAARDRLLLDRARFYLAEGDELGAVTEASPVADGAGEEVVEARLLIARVHFRLAGDLEGLAPARAVLLPAVGDLRVLEILESIRMVELLVERAEDGGPPEALFAAAELARDGLEARPLARALMLRYVEATDTPWRGKALLAALALTDDPVLRPALLRRMARMRTNPYLAASPAPGTGAPPRILDLDAALQEMLTPVLADAARLARQLDVLARERADTAR